MYNDMSQYDRMHRAASEYLLSAVIDADRVLDHLDRAQNYEEQAMQAATDYRQRLLSRGLLNTVATIRDMYQHRAEFGEQSNI